MGREDVIVRRATVADAPAISAIWEEIVAEKRFSAVARAWSPDEEAAYIEGLSSREAVFVAQVDGRVVGFETLDRWVTYPSFMDHVGQLGTFVSTRRRAAGIGKMLAEATFGFAREHHYRKLVIWVRGSNEVAERFYRGLGFRECGRLSKQLLIDGAWDDEVLMELFL